MAIARALGHADSIRVYPVYRYTIKRLSLTLHAPARVNLDQARGHPLDLLDRGQTGAHLLDAVVVQAAHAVARGGGGDLVHGGVLEDLAADLFGDREHLVDADASAVAGGRAARAADGLVGLGPGEPVLLE